jgi:hypothetical protein
MRCRPDGQAVGIETIGSDGKIQHDRPRLTTVGAFDEPARLAGQTLKLLIEALTEGFLDTR